MKKVLMKIRFLAMAAVDDIAIIALMFFRNNADPEAIGVE